MRFQHRDVIGVQSFRLTTVSRRLSRVTIAWLGGLTAFAAGCTNEAPSVEATPPTPAMQVQQVLEVAQRIASREHMLATRLGRRGWSTGQDGITSVAWASQQQPGRERIASRLPPRADGAWETRIVGTERLQLGLRIDGTQPSSAELIEGRVVYRETFPGTHTVFSADAHEAELNFMLVDARAPHQFTFGIDVQASELEARQDPGQQIAFVDRQGRTRLLIGTPYAVDATGQSRVAQLSLAGDRVHMHFDPTGMQYPILLDPPLGTPSWTQLNPLTAPAGRSYYGMATLGAKIVMFGGRIAGGANTNETWEWDGSNWALKEPVTRPSPRQPWKQLATYGSDVLLFSGLGSGTNDTWRWDGTNWTQLTPAQSPPFRAGGHMAEFDGQLVLFGGANDAGVNQGDTWTWNGTNWTDLGSSASPPARSLGSMTTWNAEILLFGGVDAVGENLADTWSYASGGWTPHSPVNAPPGRLRAPMTSLASSVVLFGGGDGAALGDTWEWDGLSWTQRLPILAPAPRYGSQAASLNGNAVLFGGYDEGTYYADTWSYTAIPLASDGTVCSASAQCGSGFCVDGYCCNAACGGGAADCEACNLSGQLGSCTAASSDTLCRGAADLCDAAESCTGSSPSCPPDVWKTLGVECRASAGDCDAVEACTGASAACPADVKAGNAVTCRPVAGVCDVAETCDGSSNTCPSDVLHDQQTICTDDSNPCTRDQCDGVSPACAHVADNAGAACRVSAGSCDVAESCDGVSTTCPTDTLLAEGVVCRDSAGACDPEEACSGGSPACPDDSLTLAGSACLDDGNVCTTDVCDGTSSACTHPAGNLGALCRAADGICDVAEQCSGSSTACPTDVYLGSAMSCREASCDGGVQVHAASCAGDSAACPAGVSDACAAYSCNVESCHTTCATAAQCAPAHFCEADATCQPERSAGTACTTDNQCSSGFCADGYCCNSVCTGLCEACDVAPELGACVAVTGAPHGTREACDTDGTACGGSCNGQTRTACQYPGSSETCRVANCADGEATLEARCGGDGTCGPLLKQTCAPFLCGPLHCTGDCAIDVDCAIGNFCFGGVCEAKLVAGTHCTASNQCSNGPCVDDVCCNSACTEQCEACDVVGVEGVCSAVTGAPHGERPACTTDGSSCGGSCNGQTRTACDYPMADQNCRLGSCSHGTAKVAAFCSGTGACPALETQACAPYVCGADACLGDCAEDADCLSDSFCFANVCTTKRGAGEVCAAGNACVSEFCVDGVCCDNACHGQCEACDVEWLAGTCSPVSGAPHGNRVACDSDGSACGGACDGLDREGCLYPGEATLCRDASCAEGIATPAAHCLGTGACPGAQQELCTPYVCGATQCAGECANTQECQSDYYCSAGICQPRTAQGTSCGSNDQCQSDVCADGFCCNAACDGQCEACDIAELAGICSPVSGAPHAGRAACAGTGSCAGSCDGVETRACVYPSSLVTCTPAACSAGMSTQTASCTGTGSCQTAIHRSCSPYTCGTNNCHSTCTTDADCVSGYLCSDAECKSPPAADGGMPDAAVPPPDAAMTEPDAGPGALDAGADASRPPEPPRSGLDSDRDGIPDAQELGANGASIDTDGDGLPNEQDPDDDGDGIPTKLERGGSRGQNDLDRDGVPNYLDRDADGDGVDDEDEATGDVDGDGIPDYKDKPRLGVAGGALCAVHAAGSNRVGGAAWLLLAAALLLLARRVRSGNSPLRASVLPDSRWLWVGVGLAAALASRPAAAQSMRLNQYTPPMLADDGLQVGRPLALDQGSVSALLVLDYANDPLVLELERGLSATERTHFVQNQVEGGFRFAYGLFERFSVSAGVDFIPLMKGERYADPATRSTLAAADGAGFGDARIGARWVMAGDARSAGALGIQAQLTLPLAEAFASDQHLSGEDGVSFRPELLLEIKPGRFRFTANAGLVLRRGVQIFETTLGHGLTYGAGAALNLATGRVDLDLMLEAFGSTSFDSAFERSNTPLEALGGVRLKPGKLVRVSAAAGPGLSRGVGSPDFRALASIAIMTEGTPEAEDSNELRVCPDGASVSGDAMCPASDRDGDDIADAKDSCPDQAEDADGFRDDDGCPDLDDDGDAVADLSDKCPRDAEDADGFEDKDGCPDRDDDADLVADTSDRCPREAEDRDGFEDGDGCPELDNDRDGVPDAQDACPLLPGSALQHGCSAVTIEGGQLKLSQRIEFAPNKNAILPASDGLMEDIRTALERTPNVLLVAVEGHTDSLGSATRNQQLSKRRAEAVVRWLARHDIALDRMQAWGCGFSRPLEGNDTVSGRQRNRRVEFHIVDPAPERAHDTQGCERAGTPGAR